MKAWDSYTIQKEPISSYNLMERAGKKCFNEIIKQFPKKRFHIIVNKGNNGGDGLVILRHLIQITKKARLTIIDISKNETKDFTKNLKLIEGKYTVEISSKNISHMKNESTPIEYWIALEPESNYSV